MGRPRKDSNKSDSGSTAGNVYNASMAAAHSQKTVDSPVPEASIASVSTSNGSSLTPQLDSVSLEDGNNKVTAAISPESNPMSSPASTSSNTTTTTTTPAIHRRSLSIAELISLVSSRNSSAAQHSTPSTSAINSLNLPEALKNTLEKADSPILSALLPLIRQKLAAKTAVNRRNSTADLGVNPNVSTSSLESRRSSTSSRSEDHRLSHKLAERKRRKEMKDVFDNLKDVLPPGVPKSSKWEILNEASLTIDELLAHEQVLLNHRNQLLKKINENK